MRCLEAYLTWFLPIETEAYVRESIAKTYERGAQKADFDPVCPRRHMMPSLFMMAS